MPVDLDQLLTLDGASPDEVAMLDGLQANILRPHVRDSLSVLFLNFGDAAAAKVFLSRMAHATHGVMKSATDHFAELAAFAANGTPGSTYVGLGLSAAGYDLLGVAPKPDDVAFGRGMTHADSRGTLGDPPLSVWEEPYRQLQDATTIHAVVLIGDAADIETSGTRDVVLGLMSDTVTVLGEETGIAQRNAVGAGIEHFGYIDGRSQPLFLTEDVAKESGTADGVDTWNPGAPLGQVLVPDPGSAGNFGSYFVFRKLEQNVRRFRQAEADLAAALGIADPDRAGAMVVGRFRDGTPLTLQQVGGAAHPIMNNFTYDDDVLGAKCPFHAHIRKTNPRGSGGAEPPEDERRHLMARRGQTYGERTDVPFDESVPVTARPTGGVGLLFMAFNSKIHFDFAAGVVEGAQFDFTQAIWANNGGFPIGKPDLQPGLDPVIGQGGRTDQTYPREWAGAMADPVRAVAQAVRMRGGEYFFMPSLPFLRGL